MPKDPRHATSLDKGLEWLRAERYPEALAQLRRCPPGGRRNIALAEALLGDDSNREHPREAYRLLLKEYNDLFLSLKSRFRISPSQRKRLVQVLFQCASRIDPQLATVMNGGTTSTPVQGRSLHVLKEFYFGNALLGYPTCGEYVLDALGDLEDRMRSDRTLIPTHYTIQFAKQYSSSTVLHQLAPDVSVGGGYFFNLGGYGCVVDPGHDFLVNFYELGRSLADIDCIIVTHFHDDHYADLPALLSLLNKCQNSKVHNQRVRVLLDAVTARMFGPLINNAKYLDGPPVVLKPRSNQPISLTPEVVLRTLPTHHRIINEQHTGVGLDFYIQCRNCHLVITGDTAWTPSVSKAYLRFRGCEVVLVAHVSSAAPEEVICTLVRGHEVFYSKHLCIHGLCKAIETVQPKKLVLSEIGEELKDVLKDLIEMIERVYGIPTTVGNLEAEDLYL